MTSINHTTIPFWVCLSTKDKNGLRVHNVSELVVVAFLDLGCKIVYDSNIFVHNERKMNK